MFCEVARAYLEKTRAIRLKEMQLFISFQKPYKAVLREIISCWISSGTFDPGLDMNIFSPHNLRAASSLKAIKIKVLINTILEIAGGTGETTFLEYYNKLIKEEGQFRMTLLEDNQCVESQKYYC